MMIHVHGAFSVVLHMHAAHELCSMFQPDDIGGCSLIQMNAVDIAALHECLDIGPGARE
jgi:hypothetical protein